MTSAQDVGDTRLDAYFDGELDADERAAFERVLAGDPGRRADLDELGLMREHLAAGLMADAEAVPEARFEQIWDEIERTLDRDLRLQEAADRRTGAFSRISAWLRPAWGPVLVVGGVAAAAVFFLTRGPAPEEANNPPTIASKSAAPGERAPEAKTVTPPPRTEQAPEVGPRLAEQAIDASFGQPSEAVAEIQQIEFGEHGGRISQMEGGKGTVTVIWVTEDEDPADSERSL